MPLSLRLLAGAVSSVAAACLSALSSCSLVGYDPRESVDASARLGADDGGEVDIDAARPDLDASPSQQDGALRADADGPVHDRDARADGDSATDAMPGTDVDAALERDGSSASANGGNDSDAGKTTDAGSNASVDAGSDASAASDAGVVTVRDGGPISRCVGQASFVNRS